MKKLLLILFFLPSMVLSQGVFNFPDLYNLNIDRFDTEENWGSNYNDFYPIGWSVDGKIAYLTIIEYQSGIGGFVCQFIIKNMKNDKVIDSIDFDFSDASFIKKNWHNDSLSIHYLLNKHKIQNDGFGKFNFSSSTKSFKIIFAKGNNKYKLSTFLYPDSINLIADLDYGDWDKLYYGGYFESPFEDRIAILIVRRRDGFEGEHDFGIEFYGKKLD